jgi:TctA family transporter
VRQALGIADGSLAIFVGSPIAIGMLGLTALIFIIGLWPKRRRAPAASGTDMAQT